MPSENLTNARAARGKSTPPTGGDEIDAMMLGGNDGKGGNGASPAAEPEAVISGDLS